MQKQRNKDIREKIARNGLMYCEVASALGVHRSSLSRMLSREKLSEGTRFEILMAIDRASEKKSEG